MPAIGWRLPGLTNTLMLTLLRRLVKVEEKQVLNFHLYICRKCLFGLEMNVLNVRDSCSHYVNNVQWKQTYALKRCMYDST